MAPNPNPSRTTAPMWQFVERVLALEPDDFVFAGAYTLKSGYHATVNDNLQRWPGTYSVRLPADLRGPRDKGRALDIKSKQAAAGKAPTIMAKYGARMRAAAKTRDPRVRKWREVLGQFDLDKPPEGIDFQSLAERQPDDTHEWHFHWSILTEFVDDAEAYDGMYSVLIGQSLTDYQSKGIDMSDGPLAENAERAATALYTGADPVFFPHPWDDQGTEGKGGGYPNPIVALGRQVEAIAADVASVKATQLAGGVSPTVLQEAVVQALLDPRVREAMVAAANAAEDS